MATKRPKWVSKAKKIIEGTEVIITRGEDYVQFELFYDGKPFDDTPLFLDVLGKSDSCDSVDTTGMEYVGTDADTRFEAFTCYENYPDHDSRSAWVCLHPIEPWDEEKSDSDPDYDPEVYYEEDFSIKKKPVYRVITGKDKYITVDIDTQEGRKLFFGDVVHKKEKKAKKAPAKKAKPKKATKAPVKKAKPKKATKAPATKAKSKKVDSAGSPALMGKGYKSFSIIETATGCPSMDYDDCKTFKEALDAVKESVEDWGMELADADTYSHFPLNKDWTYPESFLWEFDDGAGTVRTWTINCNK